MKIKHLKLHRFRGFEDLQITFPADAQTIVFIGENGSGKTSLIDGISMILREALYKHHNYEAVDWRNPLNVHSQYRRGKIELSIQGAKRDYQFSQRLSVNRQAFVTEERIALDKGRDLTDEERIAHYTEQADIAEESENYELALKKYQTLLQLLEKQKTQQPESTANAFSNMGNCYKKAGNYNEAILFYNKSLAIYEKQHNMDLYIVGNVYFNLGFCYAMLDNVEKAFPFYEKALDNFLIAKDTEDNDIAACYRVLAFCSLKIGQDATLTLNYAKEALKMYKKISQYGESQENIALSYYTMASAYLKQLEYKNGEQYFQKAVKILENEESFDLLNSFYKGFAEGYRKINDLEKSTYYESKIRKELSQSEESKPYLPLLYQTNEPEMLKHFTEYVETWVSLVVHYSARHFSTDAFKDASPIAFDVPMTTNFDMVSDWFTQHENDENRKRLRVKSDYRSIELQTIREVILKGLTLLNGGQNNFSELQTEIEETVRDGQVSSWLSIKKDGLRLNVKQLSDGEKRVLVLLIDIVRRLITVGKNNNDTNFLNGTGVVLIDEVEQHLHPTWQRNLLPTLTKIFPKLQFVVTTHSPQILSYVPNGCAFSLENGKAYPQNTYGRNNEWILETIMQDVNRPVEVQERLDAYFDAIREDKTEEAQKLRKWLEDTIGADEPELLKADILIRRKQKSSIKNETN